METLKVILHVNEMDRWPVALGNAANLLKGAGGRTVDALVLANGKAVIAYDHSEELATIRELAEQGIVFHACRNSMRKMKKEGKITITEEDLPDFIRLVPAGIIFLIEKQQEGYAYVKP